MYKLVSSFLATSIILMTGCATTKSIQYPLNGKNTTVSVSSEQISAMTESGGGDYFINGSQITVGDASNALSNPTSGMFGLIGVGVATAIDKKANGSAISQSSLNKAIKFDALVNQKINDALDSNQVDSSLKVLAINQPSEIKIIPYSRISFKEKPDINIGFGIKSQFKNSMDNNASTKRLYSYISTKKAPLTDWGKNDNALFFDAANTAFTALSKVLVLDMQHQLQLESFDENKQKNCKKSVEMNNLNFISAPNDLCIAVFKTNKNQAFQNIVFVVEQ